MPISKILKIIVFTIFDLFVFVFCGIYMMGYDDLYNESQGEYFSFSSMETEYKIVWGFYNFWLVLNCILLFYIIYRVYKRFV
ncbi:hypothetical protein BKM63_13090 [Flavobacterium johnsoniae]|jgi:hypothetical protein|uniref:Uncharacterized protein n=1 Tax=Flavobacterium johnsoniae TaxID=986 RepID=A0A1J7CIR5_FLAJO|nr:hypothetical protein BKM63_13090 [Flavobacterium johnsoniae]